MNCPNCGAPMKFDHEKIVFSCEYCTSIHFPEESRDGIRSTDEPGRFSCPVCSLPLVNAYAGKIRVLYCTRCRGILIDQPAFLPVVQHLRSKAGGTEIAPPPLRFEELERKITCPQCRNRMDTHPYGGPGNIVIDNCPRCLLNWLDYNELYRITHSPDRLDRVQAQTVDYEKLFRSKKKHRDRD